MSDLVIFGTGGMGREVHQIVLDRNADGARWNLLGFLDGNADRHGSSVHELPVLGDETWLAGRPEVSVVVAIGATPAKLRVVRAIERAGCARFVSLVHPRAWIGKGIELGPGCVVCADALLTTDVRVGRHVILNLACTVSHDATLADYVTVAPGVNISGAVCVGEGCDLGTGSSVIQGVRIGHWCVIGAGAVVLHDVAPNVTAVGVPAQPIKTRPEGWQLQ